MRQRYPSGGKQSFASASRRLFRGQVRAGSTPNRVRNWCAYRGAFAMYCMGQRQGNCRRNIQPKVTWIRSRIARVFNGDRIRRIVLAIPESRLHAGAISAKGNRKQFEGVFLQLESETVNTAEDLIFAERCREDCGRRGNCSGSPERSEAGLSVDIEI